MLIMQGNEFLQATPGTSERHITWDDDPWAENLFENMELDEVCLCTCFVQKVTAKTKNSRKIVNKKSLYILLDR